jgi:hypothetical protein
MTGDRLVTYTIHGVDELAFRGKLPKPIQAGPFFRPQPEVQTARQVMISRLLVDSQWD